MSKPTIHEVPLTPSIFVPSGTEIVIEGTTLKLIHAGRVLATRSLALPGTDVSAGVIPTARQLTSVFIVQEGPKMPGVIAVNTGVSIGVDGAITFQFSDGESKEFADLTQLYNECKPIDTEVETAKKMICLKAYRNSPDGANLSTMVGASCAIDFNADIPVVLTPAV